MSRYYICSTERPDSAHIIHEFLVQNIHGNIQRVKALIDFGATIIFISLSLLRKLKLPHKPAFTSTQCLNGLVMMSARESQNACVSVHSFEHHKPVDESEVEVVQMTSHAPVLGLEGFKATNAETDCTKV
jgi:hypothetical protein